MTFRQDRSEQLNQSAVDANKFQGKVWAFPESTEAMALWYNKDKVKEAPKSVDDLLKQAAEVGLAYNSGFYQSAGILLAEDGKVLDDQPGVCVWTRTTRS